MISNVRFVLFMVVVWAIGCVFIGCGSKRAMVANADEHVRCVGSEGVVFDGLTVGQSRITTEGWLKFKDQEGVWHWVGAECHVTSVEGGTR